LVAESSNSDKLSNLGNVLLSLANLTLGKYNGHGLTISRSLENYKVIGSFERSSDEEENIEEAKISFGFS
jgi:hypothetical protein